jgi:cytochrome c biogenesis protein CcmG/thiol:disulfide interchange protein DsbE
MPMIEPNEAGGRPAVANVRQPTTPPSRKEADEEAHRAPGRSRRRRLVIAGSLAGLAVAVGLLAIVLSREPATGPARQPAVTFELENVRREEPPVSLADYRGRPVVLNFFASWCVPCRREMPDFEAVHDRLGNRVAFVGVNHQDQRPAALDLLEETGVTYPSGFDPRGTVAGAYGLFGMPTTIFISPDGRVLERRTGEMSKRELEATIRRLFDT